MRRRRLLPFPLILICLTVYSHAQLWSGILNSATGSCDTTAAAACAVDWTNAGIPGYNPSATLPDASWTQSGATITATGSDQAPQIQTALTNCGGTSSAGKYVLLAAGTFVLHSGLTIPSYCVLRGSGANNTILQESVAGAIVIQVGGGGQPMWAGVGTIPVTGGTAAGSTSFTVSTDNIGSFSAGQLALITQLNSNHATPNGSEGNCGNTCDNGQGGTRVEGTTVYITGVNSSTGAVSFSPALPVSLTATPLVQVWTPKKNAGVEALQVYATGATAVANFDIFGCYQCWIDGVEGNYADNGAVHVYVEYSFQSQVTNSYFSNGYFHGPGTDVTVEIRGMSAFILIQNNIMERLHADVIIETSVWGSVVAYNYMFGDFDNSAPNANFASVTWHGANPMFNLVEGNIGALFAQDSIWGSNTNNTFFRNWARGTDYACNSTALGRNTVTCTPLGYPTQAGANGWIKYQTTNTINPTFETFNINLVGNVLGSAQLMAVTDENNNPLPYIDSAWSLCAGAGGTPCGTNSRMYGGSGGNATHGYTWGYGEASSSGGTGADGQGCGGPTIYTCESQLPWTSSLVHGDYSYGTNAPTWATGLTHTLPASFYLSASPSWWGTVPWPYVGPDVTGGTFVNGHASNNPAKNCYESVMGGQYGAGSPLTFNAANCYGSTGAQIPNPPTGLVVAVN
jgi:Pectate lyase superfamily protein